MLQVGDRVMVNPNRSVNWWENKRGYIVGEAEKEYGFDWDVMFDGGKLPYSFHESELTKVNVTILEGPLTWNERGCVWMVGDKNLDHYLDNNGEEYRITVEKVAKEG